MNGYPKWLLVNDYDSMVIFSFYVHLPEGQIIQCLLANVYSLLLKLAYHRPKINNDFPLRKLLVYRVSFSLFYQDLGVLTSLTPTIHHTTAFGEAIYTLLVKSSFQTSSSVHFPTKNTTRNSVHTKYLVLYLSSPTTRGSIQ